MELPENSSLVSNSSDTFTDYGSSKRSFITTKVPNAILSWVNLSVFFEKNHKCILNDVYGYAKPGELIALMGSSGAGKTTLLNSLMHRNLKGLVVKGDINLDGSYIGNDISQMCGYIQQDELFLSSLTVKEHLTIQAKLRLPHFNSTKQQSRVNGVMRELGLLKCQNTLIGSPEGKKGISGGEAKRLAFASELLNNPSILFCDEPTTGLDSFMAESVIQTLKKLTDNGRTVICTIHQPSSQIYFQFDKVYFLSNGRVAYYGPPKDAVKHFKSLGYVCPENYNPSDMIIEKLSMVYGQKSISRIEELEKICDAFIQSEEYQGMIKEIEEIESKNFIVPKKKVASTFTQILTIFQRSIIDTWRNPHLAKAKLSQKTIMGLFIGFLYFQIVVDGIGINNINGGLYYIVAELTYATLFGIIACLPSEYNLLVREYHDGMYSVFSYYVARCLSYLPLFTVDGFIMLTLSYWLMGLAPSLYNFMWAIIIQILIEQCSASFGVCLSTCAPSYAFAISLAGPLVTILTITGGLFANVSTLPVYASWLTYISWFKHSFEALSINQWRGVADLNDGCITEKCLTPNQILNSYSFDENNFTTDILSLIFIILSQFTLHLVYSFINYFRGRKWNPLKKRQDTVILSMNQIYIISILTVFLIFISPTVMMYYFFFGLVSYTLIYKE
uniref:ABC transporter domain-containing protein n=1 Tax=Strongyloides papillosus TaxID=174720 RepID=A0A0N5C4T2_STREA